MELEPNGQDSPLQLISSGSGNIQINHLTIVVNDEKPPKQCISMMQLTALGRLAEEVAAAEDYRVDVQIIMQGLSDHLNVSDVRGIESTQYRKAELFLNGWLGCAQGLPLADRAVVAQVLRIWLMAPPLKPVICAFSKTQFQNTKLDTLPTWALRCVLDFAMHKWCQYWKTED